MLQIKAAPQRLHCKAKIVTKN